MERITVAAFQAPDLQGDLKGATSVVMEATRRAEESNADVVVFPECYLQGYALDEPITRSRALHLRSPAFEGILRQLSEFRPTIIVGLIEEKGGALFNTAVVIKNGRLVGAYRKVNIHSKESVFTAGDSFPVFKANGVPFGINICYDARFEKTAAKLSQQGARVIFYPLNNRLPHEAAHRWRECHIEYLKERAQQTGAFVVSADVVVKTDVDTGYGCTAIVTPRGAVLQQAAYLEPTLIVEDVTF